ncbi:hypothetical protein ABEB36_002347 [Hypothenemus hampei]|uniref:UmuC domain-containing protein n=1 Tax=Hypothenemus hampei TaxID=57062 RepID=A0ABD1F818_HYPHA
MDDHSRVIIHFDIDCFYAQVEMVKNPKLRSVPLGIQQKTVVVTSNYLAREYGIKKCMRISEAKELCPNLVLVKGEDLYDYRQTSNKVFELLQSYSPFVEKLGMDENFVDVTELVKERLQQAQKADLVGFVFGDVNSTECVCGCQERLLKGSEIAQEIRDKVYTNLGLTTCAGIAHNKILAKIVGSENKPNKQTVLFPNDALELMLSLRSVRRIPWIGNAAADVLERISITTVEELHNCDLEQLGRVFDRDKAKNLKDLSFGIDNTPVKTTGKPLSIGLEDACKLTEEKAVQTKFHELLKRLLILVKEDGRIPKVIRITVRKFNPLHPMGGLRETRQCHINIPLTNEEKFIQTAMNLFWKIINRNGSFKVTVLGLSFTKFADKPSEKNTLNTFLMKTSQKEYFESDASCSNQEPVLKRGKFLQDNVENSENAIECPPGVDKTVFKELPLEVQQEIWSDYTRNKQLMDKNSKSKLSKPNTLFNFLQRQKH